MLGGRQDAQGLPHGPHAVSQPQQDAPPPPGLGPIAATQTTGWIICNTVQCSGRDKIAGTPAAAV